MLAWLKGQSCDQEYRACLQCGDQYQVVRMSKQARRSSCGVREVLKEIANENAPSTLRKNSTLESIKLNEAMSFLQRKIERQYSEVQMLSEQLSREISLNEELAEALKEEREKLAKAALHLSNANKANVELRKKVAKLEQEAAQGHNMRSQYEIKLNKYRDMVRKKDELLAKNQQKLEDLLRAERATADKELEATNLKETVLKLRGREEAAAAETAAYKRKNADLQLQLDQQTKLFHDSKQQLLFATEKASRLQQQFDELTDQSTKREAESATLIHRLTMNLQQQQSELMRLMVRPAFERPEWDLNVYKNEIRRMLGNLVKDNNLRRKVEKETIEVMEEVERAFAATVDQLIRALQV